jgi:hypothetical protein
MASIATTLGLPLGISPLPPRSFDADKVINASMQHTGGIPYFLYKVAVETLRPMLPKGLDPEDPKYVDDPRVRRYLRIGGVVDKSSAAVTAITDPRRRLSGAEGGSPDVNIPRSDSKTLLGPIPPVPKALLEPLALNRQESESAKVPILLEGLTKPLVPLPKLLDPRMARQLSLDKDDKDKLKSKEQTSPGSSSKTPFSHRNDPRFRKKSKDGQTSFNSALNSSTDSDSNSNTQSQYEEGTDKNIPSADVVMDTNVNFLKVEEINSTYNPKKDLNKGNLDEDNFVSHRHSPSNEQFTANDTDDKLGDFPTTRESLGKIRWITPDHLVIIQRH